MLMSRCCVKLPDKTIKFIQNRRKIMNPADIFLLILIAVAVIAAIGAIVRSRKKGGGCSGNCSACHGCSHEEKNKQDRK